MGVGSGDVDDLANAVHRTGLEGNVPDAGLGETLDDLSGLLRRRNTSSNTKSFNGETFTAHLLPERKLEGELAGVDVKRIQGDADTRRDVGLNLREFGTEGCGVVVAPSCQLDVVTGGENSAHETRLDG